MNDDVPTLATLPCGCVTDLTTLKDVKRVGGHVIVCCPWCNKIEMTPYVIAFKYREKPKSVLLINNRAYEKLNPCKECGGHNVRDIKTRELACLKPKMSSIELRN